MDYPSLINLLEGVRSELKKPNFKKLPKTAPKATSNNKASESAAKKKLAALKAMSDKGQGKALKIKATGSKKHK